MLDKRDQIISLWGEGLAGIEIASRTGFSRTTVYRVLERAGIDTAAHAYKRARKFTDEKVDEIVRRYEAGQSSLVLAEAYGTTSNTIISRLRERGVKIRPRHEGRERIFTDAEVAHIVDCYQSGFTQEQIAAEHRTNQIRISRILTAENVPTGRKRSLRKNGRHITGGYVFTRPLEEGDERFSSMVNSTGYILEHRLVMARQLGRSLDPSETVHHVDGDTQNNSLENLQLRQGRHGKGVRYACGDCGSQNIGAITLD